MLIDRISVSPDARLRIVDAVEQGYREAGEVLFETAPREGEAVQQFRFSQRFECKQCDIRYEEPEPRLFSFNNPFGACPRCQGFGNTIDFDLNLVIPNKTLTLAEGAIEPWTKPKYKPLATEMRRYARAAGIPLDVPWQDLTADQQSFIINGDGKFWGVRGFFEHLERKKYKLHVRVFLSRYRGYSVCSDCGGLRLRREARQVKIAGKDICQVSAMTVEEATRFFAQVELTRQEADIASKLLEEINDRLRYLNDVGLEYLTLDRLASTLSGGEAQRIQLATSLGSRLVGTLYVLDEPSIGLHQPRHRAPDQNSAGSARPGKHDSGGRARCRHHALGRSHPRSRTGRGRKWRSHDRQRDLRRDSAESGFPHRTLSQRRAADPTASRTPHLARDGRSS